MTAGLAQPDTKQCPRCGEDLRLSAIVCRFCGFDYADVHRRSTNGFAIASFVLGILWLASIGSILAIVFGAIARRQNARTGEQGNGLALAGVILGVIGLALSVALLAIAVLDGPPKETPPAGLESPPRSATVATATVTPATRLMVSASRGNCWLEVHSGSATGGILFQGTLERGQRKYFTGRKLWITLDRPENLITTLNGRTRMLPGSGVKTLVVSSRGIRSGV